MKWNREIWSVLFVTIVTLLIWVWAASETRESVVAHPIVHFAVPEETATWLVQPDQEAISITLEGSKVAIRNAQQSLEEGVQVLLKPEPGMQQVDLLKELISHDVFQEAGVSVVATDPGISSVNVDTFVQLPIRIVFTPPPGMQTVSTPIIEPAEATLTLPSQMHERLSSPPVVEAIVSADELDRLPPGVPHTIDVPLAVKGRLGENDTVTISPSTAQVSLTIRSLIREHLLDHVWVHVSGPPDNEYSVTLPQPTLQQVLVSADADLIQQIIAEEMYVVAVVQLSLRDKEQGVTEKPVTYFVALPTEADSAQRAQPVTALKVGESTEPPTIELNISKHSSSS